MAADPQWLRSTLCEDLADYDRSHGVIPDTRLIERTVDEDIRRWAAENREGAVNPIVSDAQPEKEQTVAKEIEASLADAKHSRNLELHTKAAPDFDPVARCPCGGHCRGCKLRARLLALLEAVPLEERQHKVEPWKNCRRPLWARDVLSVYTWMKFSRRAKLLAHKGELDAVVQRKLEDIADRSATALPELGPWR